MFLKLQGDLMLRFFLDSGELFNIGFRAEDLLMIFPALQ